MRLIIIFLIIFTINCKSQNIHSQKKINVSLIDLHSKLRVNKDTPFKLLWSNLNFSFDKFYILDNKIVGCDETRAKFYLIDLEDNTILDRLELKEENEVIKKKLKPRPYNTNDLLTLNSILNNQENNYFTKCWDPYPFVELNDSVLFVGFFKFYETKHFNQQLNIIVSQNKLKIEYTPYYSSAFEVLKEKNSNLILANAMDFSSMFTFQDNLYCYFPFSPYKQKNGLIKSKNIITRVLSNKSFELVLKEPEAHDKSHLDMYDFCEKDEYLFQYSDLKDSLIIRDKMFKPIYTINTSKLTGLNSKKRGLTYMFKDPSTNRLYLIKRCKDDITENNLETSSELYIYNIIELEFKNNLLKTKFIKKLILNRQIHIQVFLKNSLYFTLKSPLYNTSNIYTLDLSHQEINNIDTVRVSIKNFNTVDALHYQSLLDPFQDIAFEYKHTPRNIRRKSFGKLKKINSIYPQNTIKNLFVSIQKCLKEKNYDYLYSHLLTFEEYKLKTLKLLTQNSILKHDSALYNQEFFKTIIRDISELCQKHSNLEIDYFCKISFLKTSTGRYYTLVKDKDSWYLRATIGSESGKYIESNEREEFARKYPHLEYIEHPEYDKKTNFEIFGSVTAASTLPKKLCRLCFPNILNQIDSFHQKSVSELYSSLQKAFKEGRIDYVKTKLMIYPLAFINDCNETNNCDYLLKDTISKFQRKLIKKYQEGDYEEIVLSKKIILHKYILDNNLLCTQYLIRKKRKWYVYSRVRVRYKI